MHRNNVANKIDIIQDNNTKKYFRGLKMRRLLDGTNDKYSH